MCLLCYSSLAMKESSDTLLVNYLSTIGGDLPWIEPLPESTSKLPPFLKQRYRISRADLFGRKYLLAIEGPREGDLSPTEYARDARTIKERLTADVILVLSNIPAYVRNRLVHQKVPFIVPGTQMFLPMLMIDLREHFPKSKTKSQDVLSAVSQLVILYHLSRESLSETPLGQIASRLRYSPMAISKAQDELQNADLCEVHRSGRTLSLHFHLKGKRSLAKSRTPIVDSCEADTVVPLGKTKCACRDCGNDSSQQIFNAGRRSPPHVRNAGQGFRRCVTKRRGLWLWWPRGRGGTDGNLEI